MCGVMPWWGIVRHRWSFGAGCGNHTSPAYPASCPDAAHIRSRRGRDLAARRVDDVGAALHAPDHRLVEQALGLRVERRVDRHHVAVGHHVLGRSWKVTQLVLDLGREPVAVRVVEAHLERLQAPQHGGADPAGGHGSDLHPLDVIGETAQSAMFQPPSITHW